jgi:Cu/Zn superoxide dismutase
MMYRARRLSGTALAVTMFAALAVALSAGAGAQEDQTMKVDLTPSRDSGVSGTATLEDVEDGVEVTLEMRNLPKAGIKHINHIHAGGTCADDRDGRTAPVTIPLETITAQDDGTGSATTTIKDVSVGKLFNENEERFILLHAEAEKGEGVPPGIACADLVRPAANGTTLHDESTMMGETTMTGEATMMVSDIPSSGGSSILLLAAALLVGAGVLGYAMLRRGA